MPVSRYDLDNPADALAVSRKLQVSLEDGAFAYFAWQGRLYSRVEGEPDRHLFNLLGMSARQSATVEDPQRGPGYNMISRELMLYLDPATNQPLKTWRNPWTGQEIEVVHVANDPVKAPIPMFLKGRDGAPFHLDARLDGDKLFVTYEIPLFYPNPLGGAYQDYVGGHYHAMEIFDCVLDAEDALDASKPMADVSIAWMRLSPWLPWMEMGSRPGLLVANATSRKMPCFEDLPEALRNQVEAHYPAFRAPPDLDDPRPSQTSWTHFRDRIEARRPGASK